MEFPAHVEPGGLGSAPVLSTPPPLLIQKQHYFLLPPLVMPVGAGIFPL